MFRTFLLFSLVLPQLSLACATVPRGLSVAQKGMGVVDFAFDEAAEKYVRLVLRIRQHCAGTVDSVSCEVAHRVADSDVEKVCGASFEPGEFCGSGAARMMSDAYDQAAQSLSAVKGAWVTLDTEIQSLEETLDDLAE